ncbi:MAG: hypothetical protein ACFFC3_05165 [Candidatus Odinarchaeota archaeon]
MALEDLGTINFLKGSFSLIWVMIAVFIGIRIIIKAISLKRKDLVAVGVTWVLMTSGWWGVSTQFITYGFFDYKLTDAQYLAYGNLILPFTMMIWMYAFVLIMDLKRGNILVIAYIIFNTIWLIIVIIALTTDNIDLIGTVEPEGFDSQHSFVSDIFIYTVVASFLITGIIFSIRSIRIGDPEIKLKAYFLLIAWILFTIGAYMDTGLGNPTELSLVLVRLILILSAIFYYLGWFLPKSISNRLRSKNTIES